MKTVLITGCSSGIGKAAAALFSQKGWNVAATMRNPEKGRDIAAMKNVKVFPLDVTDPASIAEAVGAVTDAFGSIDALVNNAGFSLIGPFETTGGEEVRKQYETNVFGLMNAVRAVLPVFRKKRGGTIVNLASVGGRIAFPMYSLYNGTKFAVEGFSESLQYELKPFNIRVKIVEPGVILTDFYGRSMVHQEATDMGEYYTYAEKTLARLQNIGKQGIPAETAAKTIYKAAASSSSKLRYPVGPDARMLFVLKRILPEAVIRRIVRAVTS